MAAASNCPCRGEHSTIEHLKRIVKTLRVDDGPMSWVEDEQSKTNFRVMEEDLHVLKSLASTFDAHICAIRKRDGVSRLSPESLPDEIITQIFGYIEYNVYTLTKFTHISARIRRVIRHAPFLWAKLPLDVRLRGSAMAHIARHSGTLGVTAIIQLTGVFYDKVELAKKSALLNEMFRHAHRWTLAEFNLSYDWGKFIADQFAEAKFDSLRALGIQYEDCPADTFYRSWTMPLLDDLRFGNYIPRGLQPSTTTALTKCAFRISGCEITQLMKLLGSTPNLTILRIDLMADKGDRHSYMYGDRRDRRREICLASLPALDYLEYKASYPDEGAIEHLFQCIVCPNVKRISYFSHVGDGGHEDYMLFSGYIRERYPALTSLELHFNCGRTYNCTDFFLEDILRALPTTVEKVWLDIWTANLRTSQVSSDENEAPRLSYPNLKDLDIEKCMLIREDRFYANVADCLGRLGVTLRHFRPSKHLLKEAEDENILRGALDTLRQAGVLVD